MSRKIHVERVGETNLSNQGHNMTIVKYRKSTDIDVEFNNGYIVNTRYECFLKGQVSNPYHKSVYGVGYIGVGKHKTYNRGKFTKKYEKWCDLFKRSYAESKHKRFPTYKDCTVDERWHNFQKFGDWWDENYKDYMQGWHLDKDVLIKGNKYYSPETCAILPEEINGMFISSKSYRGDLPIGVTIDSSSFRTSVCMGAGNKRHSSSHKTAEEAFYKYKSVKENRIKQLADKWRDLIDSRVYTAMIDYQIEITD